MSYKIEVAFWTTVILCVVVLFAIGMSRLKNADYEAVRKEGHRAAMSHINAEANPYKNNDGLARLWLEGYCNATEQLR
jgi:hypothetical protein